MHAWGRDWGWGYSRVGEHPEYVRPCVQPLEPQRQKHLKKKKKASTKQTKCPEGLGMRSICTACESPGFKQNKSLKKCMEFLNIGLHKG